MWRWVCGARGHKSRTGAVSQGHAAQLLGAALTDVVKVLVQKVERLPLPEEETCGGSSGGGGGSGGGGRAVVHKLIILIVLSVSAPHL